MHAQPDHGQRFGTLLTCERLDTVSIHVHLVRVVIQVSPGPWPLAARSLEQSSTADVGPSRAHLTSKQLAALVAAGADAAAAPTYRHDRPLIHRPTVAVLAAVVVIERLRARTRPSIAPPVFGRERDHHRDRIVVHDVRFAVSLVQVLHQLARSLRLTQPLPRPEVERLLANVRLGEQQGRHL